MPTEMAPGPAGAKTPGLLSQLVSKRSATNAVRYYRRVLFIDQMACYRLRLCAYVYLPQMHEDEQQPFLLNISSEHSNESISKSSAFEKRFLNIEGMTCGACSAMIQKLLSGTDGVESTSVSLLLKRAEVVYNRKTVNLDDIIDEIEDIGFTASELKMSSNNRNCFTIELFYSSGEHTRQQVVDKVMTIEGVSNVQISDTKSNRKEGLSQSMVDMSMLSIPNPPRLTTNTSYGTESRKKKPDASVQLTIHYDPGITGMRSITEWINDSRNTDFKCKILYDSSDISQRKKNIQQSRDREIKQWTHLFKYSLLFAVPAFLASMVFPWFPGFNEVFSTEFVAGCSIHDLTLFILATPIQFGPPGLLFYRGAYKSLMAGSANMDVLVALATSISYFFSIIQVVMCTIQGAKSPNTTFETSAVLITVIILGKYMETIAKGKTSQALDKLMDLAPSAARLVENWKEIHSEKSHNDSHSKSQSEAVESNVNVENGHHIQAEEEHYSLRIREIDARLIQLGDILEVPRGSKLPCDGVIVQGTSSVDESLITGESMAVHKKVGDEVIGATVNESNTIYIEVNKVGEETVLSKIITLVENAQASRAPIQNLADTIASRFVPTVIGISIIVFIVWFVGFDTGLIKVDSLFGLTTGEHGHHSQVYYSFLFAISVLVISCPCALGLATPTAVMVATGKAAELGMLFKGGEPLEMAGRTNCIVFDKTGTLTQGKMQIVDIVRVADRSLHKILKMDQMPQSQNSKDFKASRDRFWNYVYGAEKQSEHLIANAVCNFIDHSANGINGDGEERSGNDRNSNGMEEEEELYRVKREDSTLSETTRLLRDRNVGPRFECKHWAPDAFEPHTGLGVTATYKDTTVMLGSLKYLDQHRVSAKKLAKSLQEEIDDEDYDDDHHQHQLSVSTSSAMSTGVSIHDDEEDRKYEDKYMFIVRQKASQLEAKGNTCIFVAVNGECCAILSIADRIKPDAPHVLDYLQNDMNIPCYMITGDHEVTAHAIGKVIGIPADHIRANVSPADKQSIVQQLQNTHSLEDRHRIVSSPNNVAKSKKNVVMFVGDGINDSPSLAQADVGVAIGAGTDVAIASAQVVLMNSKLRDVLNTIDISKATVRRIRYNFAWALVYNLCMIPFAAGVFYPIIHYALPPFMAGLLMCLSSISVVCNSLVLKLYKPPQTDKQCQATELDSLVRHYQSDDLSTATLETAQ